jgi:isochorismate hydrolase
MALPPILSYPMPGPDLAPNIARWVPDRRRAVLLIHDMQRYFVDAFPAGASPVRELIANAARLRSVATELGLPVLYTMQPQRMSARERGLLRDFWGPGMTADPAGHRIVAALTPAPADQVVTKWRYSAFHRTDLLGRIRATGRDQVLICGVYAHLGCLATAFDAFSHDLETFLIADAVADFDEASHAMSLRRAATGCAVVLTTGRAVRLLRS